jgi:HK97 family phage major capsid protein
MDLKQLEEQMQKLMGELETIHKTMKEKGSDAIRQDELDKISAAAAAAVEKRMYALPDGAKFGSGEGNIGLQQFLRMVKENDPRLRGIKTVEQSTTDGDGGYTMPDEFAGRIIELAQNAAIIAPMCTDLPQAVETVNIPKALTNPAIAWVAEKAAAALSKMTTGNAQSVLKKMMAIVPLTSEILDFNQVNLQGVIERAVSLGMARELDRVILAGSTDAGDPFKGILYETGVNATASDADKTSYDNFVDAMNSVTIEAFHANAKWLLNRAGLKAAMKVKNLQDDPIFFRGGNGLPSTILDKPFVITDVIPAAATTSILYGDLASVLLGKFSKNSGIVVDQSNSAIIGTTDVTQNAFTMDQIWYRWKWRRGVLVAIPSAFAKLTGVK